MGPVRPTDSRQEQTPVISNQPRPSSNTKHLCFCYPEGLLREGPASAYYAEVSDRDSRGVCGGDELKQLALTVEEDGSISSESCFNPDQFQRTACRIQHIS